MSQKMKNCVQKCELKDGYIQPGYISLVPRPLPSFPLLAVQLSGRGCTASDGKLGEGLGMRLRLYMAHASVTSALMVLKVSCEYVCSSYSAKRLPYKVSL